MNKTLLATCAGLLAGASPLVWTANVDAATPATAPAGRVTVMVSVDGLAGFYFDDPRAEMPNIRALAAGGARASGMEAVTPTVTWPNHTTLVTGDFPGRHGVVGNNYFDRATGKPVALISDGVYDKDQIVKVPTIYDLAKGAGMMTAAVRWPATRNAHALDWTIPDCKTDAMEVRYTTPSLFQECVAAGVTPPRSPADDVVDPDADGPSRFGDQAATDAFELILRTHRPGLALLHVSNVDHQEHLYGPRSSEAYAAIKQADDQVGQVWEELKRDFPERATLLVVSDHGFSPIERLVLPNVILRDAGLIKVKGPLVVGGSVRCVVQGGAAMLYFTDAEHRDEVLGKVTKAFTGVTGVERVVGPGQMKAFGVADPAVDPHAPDLIVFADEGNAFGDTAAGALAFRDKPERKGTHGHDPHLPHLQATFVAWGVGIKPGVTMGVVANRDVAPTLAAVMGLKMDGVDGKPLAACLTGPAGTANAGQ